MTDQPVERNQPLSVRCACGELIDTGMEYIETEARPGVLWHGNAEGGGHSSDVSI